MLSKRRVTSAWSCSVLVRHGVKVVSVQWFQRDDLFMNHSIQQETMRDQLQRPTASLPSRTIEYCFDNVLASKSKLPCFVK